MIGAGFTCWVSPLADGLIMVSCTIDFLVEEMITRQKLLACAFDLAPPSPSILYCVQ